MGLFVDKPLLLCMCRQLGRSALWTADRCLNAMDPNRLRKKENPAAYLDLNKIKWYEGKRGGEREKVEFPTGNKILKIDFGSSSPPFRFPNTFKDA